MFARGDDLVRVKKYFYILRPLLAIRWIQQDIGPVPMEFEKQRPIRVRQAR